MSYSESGNNLKTETQLQPLNEYVTPSQIAGGVGDSGLPSGEANNVGNILSVITGDISGQLIEDKSLRGGLLQISGTLVVSDSDAGEASFRKASIAGDYGMLNMGVNGKWSYFAANSSEAIQSLGEGQTLTETFTVESADGTTQTVTITITGVNDAAVITGDVSGSVTEDAYVESGLLRSSGVLSVKDVDAGEANFRAGSVAGAYGVLTIDAEGNWTYAADNSQPAIQSLDEGQTLTDTFTVKSADGTEQTITITINGASEAPDAVITGDVSGSVTEDAATTLTATGKLSVDDPDADESVFQAGSIDGDFGTLTIDAAGKWTYAAENGQSAIQSLGEGEMLTDTFTVKSADGTEQTVTITITGVNDAAEIKGDVSGSVTEDVDAVNDVLMITGTLAVTDVDSGEYFQVGDFDGDYGILQISETGEWVYAADNSQPAIQSLDEGQTLTDTFTVKSADGTEQTITITIKGVSEAPDAVITGDVSGSVTEDAATTLTATGKLSVSDPDADEAVFQAESIDGDLGTLTIDAAGNWTYAAENGQSAIQSLGEGEMLTDTFTVKSADGTEQTVTITITGVNDAAEIKGDVSGSVTEDVDAVNDVLMITGTLAVTDVDSGEYFQVGDFDGNYGILQISETGEWVYAADNSQPAIQSLDEGQTLTDTFTVKSADGTEQTITITITGVNDTPVIDANAELSVNDTATASLTDMLHASAPDNSASDLAYSIVSGPAHGVLMLNGVAITDFTNAAFTQDDIDKGLVTFKFDPTAGATAQALTDDSFSFTVSDGEKTTDSQTFNIRNTVTQVWGTNGADDVTGLTNYADPDATFHVYGFDGNDTLRGGANADTLDGGAGMDTADYSASDAAVNIDLRRAGAQYGGDAKGDILTGIESVKGSNHNDTITGSDGADVLYGLDGNDDVRAAFGDDTLDGGAGNDTLIGGAGADLLDGGAGMDTADYSASDAAVNIDLRRAGAQSGGDAEGDILVGIENVIGSDHNDTIIGSNGTNYLYGMDGNDNVQGAYGDDTLDGGAGNDTLWGTRGTNLLLGGDGDDKLYGQGNNDTLAGGAGADLLDGGTEIDTADYSASTAWVNVDLSLATAQMGGGDGNHALGDTLTGIENLTGSNLGDVLIGNGAANVLNGLDGDDAITAGAGDTVDGGAGMDVLYSSDAALNVISTTHIQGVERVDLTGSAASLTVNGDAILSNGVIDPLDGGMKALIVTGDAGDVVHFSGDTWAWHVAAESQTLSDGQTYTVYEATKDGETVRLYVHDGMVADSGLNEAPTIDNNATLHVNDTATASLTGMLHASDTDNSASDLTYSIVSGPAHGVLMLNGAAITDFTNAAFTQDDIDKGLVTFKFVPTIGAKALALTDDSFSFTVSDGEKTTDSQTFQIRNTVTQVWGTKGVDDLTGLANYDDPDATFHVYGFDGHDILRGGGNADTLNGGYGLDTADYSASEAAVNIDLRRAGAQSDGDAEGDVLLSIENVIGSSHNDTIIGHNGTNHLYGMDGNDNVQGAYGDDTLDGGAGNDTLWGATGANLVLGGDGDDKLYGQGNNDTLVGGAGADLLDGGTDIDTASYEGSESGVNVDLTRQGGGETQSGGDAEGDVLTGIENLTGSNLGDVLKGSIGANVLNGLDGDDAITAGAGDTVDGGAGLDVLYSSDATLDVADSTTISGVERVDLTGSATSLTVSGDAILGNGVLDPMGGAMKALVVTGDAGDVVAFASDTWAWQALPDSQTLSDGQNYTVYEATKDGETVRLYVHAGVVVDSDVNDAPAVDLKAALHVNDTATASLTGMLHASDPDNSAADLQYSIVSGPAHGVLMLNGAAITDFTNAAFTQDDIDKGLVTFKFVPTAGATAQALTDDSFSFTVSDGEKTTDSQTFQIRNTVTQVWGTNGADDLTGLTNYDDPDATFHVYGFDGNDTLRGGVNADILDGGAGVDTADYSASTSWVTVDLTKGATAQSGGGERNHATGDMLRDIENLTGSDYDDVLTGDGGANVLNGLGGNDSLMGGHGDDTLYGGDGNDTLDGDHGNNALYGGAGNDLLTVRLAYINERGFLDGGDGDDTLIGGHSADTLYGGDGDDFLYSGEFDWYWGEALYGGAGNDTLSTNNGDDFLSGGDGNDSLDGGLHCDTLYGGDGNDTLYGGIATTASWLHYPPSYSTDWDLLEGGAGNDILDGGAGADTLYGDDGNDSLYGGVSTPYQPVVAWDSADCDWLDGGAGDDTLDGGHSHDTLYGGVGKDSLMGGDGEDSLMGDDGNDVLMGGAGQDTLQGGAGDDLIHAGAEDSVDGGAGNDVLVSEDAYLDVGPSTIITGIERIDLTGASEGLTVSGDAILRNGVADPVDSEFMALVVTGDTGDWVARLADGGWTWAQAARDVLLPGDGNVYTLYEATKDAQTVRLYVESGLEVVDGTLHISGREGPDDLTTAWDFDDPRYAFKVYGLGGNDTLTGGARADTLNGGAGVDTADYSASDAAVNIDLRRTGAQSGGDAKGDILNGIENVIGSDHNDTIIGSNGTNYLYGMDGNDDVRAAYGNDTLDGGAGNDTLWGARDTNLLLGGVDDDKLYGQGGNDTLAGGAGADLLDGGTDIDTASYSTSTAWVNVDLSLATAQMGGGDGNHALGDTLTGIENLTGSNFGDVLIGNGDANVLSGLDGDDAITAGAGDTVHGGAGLDVLYSSDATLDVAASTTISGVELVDLTGSSASLTVSGDAILGNGVLDPMGGAMKALVVTGDAGDVVRFASDTWAWQALSDSQTLSDGKTYTVYQAAKDTDTVRLYVQAGVTVESGTIQGSVSGSEISGIAETQGTASGGEISGYIDESLQLKLSIIAAHNSYIAAVNDSGLDGNDTLTGGNGNDLVYGSDGDDSLYGGSQVFDFGEGLWVIPQYVDGNHDTLYGGVGNDTLDGGNGNDMLYGGDGNDSLHGGRYEWDTFMSWNVFNTDTLDGGSGNDTMDGFDGADLMYGGDGDDVLFGGIGIYDDTLDGGSGDDTLDGGNGNDVLHGGDGNDSLSSSDNWCEYYLAGKYDGNHDTMDGGSGNDTIDGGWGRDSLQGGYGNDVMFGGVGTDGDTMDGGSGHDTMDGGQGCDVMFGGDGNDSMFGGDEVYADTMDTMHYQVMQIFYGDNVFDGYQTAGDTMDGGLGNDFIRGGNGNDVLYGGGGIDSLFGDAGDDILHLNLSTTGLLDSGETILPTHIGMLDGGTGTDTLVLDSHAGSGATLDLSSLVTAGKISGIERIDITGDADDASTLTLKASDVFSTSGGNSLYIAGNAGDTVTVTDEGWSASADVTYEGQTYRHYVNQGYNLYIDAEIDQQNIIHS